METGFPKRCWGHNTMNDVIGENPAHLPNDQFYDDGEIMRAFLVGMGIILMQALII